MNEQSDSGTHWRAQVVVAILLCLVGFVYASAHADAAGAVQWLILLLLAATAVGAVLAWVNEWQQRQGGPSRLGPGAAALLGLGGFAVANRLPDAALFWVFLFTYAVGVALGIIGVRRGAAARHAG